MNGGASSASGSGYLSASKLALLVCVEQYSRHYDWGPATLSELGQFLVTSLYEATSWMDDGWHDLRDSFSKIHVHALDRSLLAIVCLRLADLHTIDALHVFFDDVARLVVDAEARIEPDGEAILLDSESVFGIFVRRCFLAFNQLEFYQISRFFAECQLMASVLSGQQQVVEQTVHSQMEMQEHVEALICKLEEESRTPVPEKMQRMIRRSLDRLPGYSRIHYLRYLDLVRRGESKQSEQSLRRFFDSNAIKDNRTIYQYALLYLAAMRVQLGMADGARHALTEATHVARDCQDHLCLLYIVCWECRLLFDMLQTQKDGKTEVALRQSLGALVAKASSMHNYELEAAGRILQTDLLVATNAQPTDVFDNLVRVRALVVEHDVGRLRTAWYLTAARAWMKHEKSMWIALLHTRMAASDTGSLTERELTEATRQMALAQATLSGPLVSALHMKTQINGMTITNPAREDSLCDTLGLLCLNVDSAEHSRMDVHASVSCASSSVRKLAEARSLIIDGYVCEARELLLSIVDSGRPRKTTAAPMHLRQSEPAAVVEMALQMLDSLDAGGI
ncbi:hypothetical protein FB645_003960 [Coemansia sp. IMI 203386]|nr:hypothetical protein FB645_003960 [Coemansia sp. IMI 203386]